jgi:hypothetical protein
MSTHVRFRNRHLGRILVYPEKITPWCHKYFGSAFCVEECGLILILDHNYIIVEVEEVLGQSYPQGVAKGLKRD